MSSSSKTFVNLNLFDWQVFNLKPNPNPQKELWLKAKTSGKIHEILIMKS